MKKSELLAILRSHRWAIEATSSLSGEPQAAIIGFAVTEQLELVFDTLSSSRKAANLRTNPRIAIVVGGWNDTEPKTLQYEGRADFPEGAELERIKEVYFSAFPEGPTRLSWPGITYVRVKPLWVRYSDFTTEPPLISEQNFVNQEHSDGSA